MCIQIDRGLGALLNSPLIVGCFFFARYTKYKTRIVCFWGVLNTNLASVGPFGGDAREPLDREFGFASSMRKKQL